MDKTDQKNMKLHSRIKSFSYAWSGIRFLFINEPNSIIHLVITIAVIIAGCYFEIQKMEWVAITLCIVLVFAAELFNTAIEKTIDLVSPEQNKMAGMVKDLSAGAVLIVAIGAVVTGIIIFLPYVLCTYFGNSAFDIRFHF